MILFHPEQLIYEIMNNLMTNMIYFWYWRQTTATKEAINRRQKKASYHLLVTTILLLKKLTIQRDSIDLLTLIASMTLSAKYQHSQPQIIDYDLIAQSCHIENIQLIHVSLSSFFILLFMYSFYYRMLNLIFSMFSPMIFVWQHLIISFLIYPTSRTMITTWNKSLNKLDLHYLTIHFHIKHLVSL
jgi:hypothetical protein